MNYKCNSCNKEITKNPDESERRDFELWKSPRRFYELPYHFERVEKLILPWLSNKYPTEYNKLKTNLPKYKDLYNQEVKPYLEKIEEVSWKFFYKKGKMFPPFKYEGRQSSRDEMCDSCYSELEKQIKPLLPDQIENERIMKKFSKMDEEASDNYPRFFEEEKLKEENFHNEFLKNKEQELNNKILSERERERERERESGGKSTNYRNFFIMSRINN